MNRLHMDAETFSSVDITTCGLDNYWDPEADTGVHCIAYKLNDGPIKIWRAQTAEGVADPLPHDMLNSVARGDLVVAHKAEFEHYMLHKFNQVIIHDVLRRRRDAGVGADYTVSANPPTLERMRCTMAKAASMALPLSLGKLSLALGFPNGKNTAGQKAMKILCKPNPKTGKHWLYEEAPQLFEDLYTYCIQDLKLEYDVDQVLPDLSDEEQAMWVLDQQINRRGVGVDRRAAAAAYKICTSEMARLDQEIYEASSGQVSSTKAVIQIARFCGMDSVAKANIEEALEESSFGSDLSGTQRRVLQIRQEAAKSSVFKLKPMLELCSRDGRVRWMQQFNGAGTGRWGGRNPQPHNFPRGVYHIPAESQGLLLDQLGRGDLHEYDPELKPLTLISDLLRGMFIASPGYEFSSYDFAQIEMRLGAWFVGDEGLLEEFRGDGLVYEFTYASTYGIEKADVTKDQRQEGKTLALGAQFGGGANALVSTAKQGGKELSEERAEELKVRWRGAHLNFPHYWKALEWAAMSAVRFPGRSFSPLDWPKATIEGGFRSVSYCAPLVADGTPGTVLCCTLPSGRVINYPYPRIERTTVVKKNGETWETDSLTYMVNDNNRWVRTHSYGGKLFENVVQAAAACLLRFGITNMNEAGIPVVLMVHDEVVTETQVGSMSWDKGREIMERRPHWCADLPIKVTGWQGRRYGKE